MRPVNCLFALLAVSAHAAASGAETRQPLSAEVAGWVHDLHHDQYARREAATQHLARAGTTAVPSIIDAAAHADPEVRWRAIDALLQMGRSNDDAAQNAAVRALESLSQSGNAELARLAARGLREWRLTVHAEAVAQLRDRGAIVNERSVQTLEEMVFGDTPAAAIRVTHVQIGEEWTGDDNDLRHAVKLFNLTHVRLQSASLTAESLHHMARMPNLERIDVNRGRISGAEWRAFRARRPEVEVFAIGEGFLGVNGQPGRGGLEVVTIYRGSCAEQCGLRPGDVITSMNGHALSDVASLTLVVFDQPEGTPVTLKVLRDRQDLTVHGKLGRRVDPVP